MKIARDQHGALITPANLGQLDRLGTTKALKWSRRAKLLAFYAIAGGLITPAAAIERWRTSAEEIEEWGRLKRHRASDPKHVLEIKTSQVRMEATP